MLKKCFKKMLFQRFKNVLYWMWPIIIGFIGLKLQTLFCSIVCDAGTTLAKPTKLVGRLIFQDKGLVGRKS